VLRLAVVLALLLASVARAGGDQVDLAVQHGTVWTVGDFGVRAFDAQGATVYAPQPTAARYDLGVAIAGGAAFVASVANGFSDGEVTRIDLRSHATRIVWRRADAAAEYVAAGPSGVYVLVGGKDGNSVLRLSPTGRVTRRWSIGDAGRIAADASGCGSRRRTGCCASVQTVASAKSSRPLGSTTWRPPAEPPG
jgi:hypothetical protein